MPSDVVGSVVWSIGIKALASEGCVLGCVLGILGVWFGALVLKHWRPKNEVLRAAFSCRRRPSAALEGRSADLRSSLEV